MPVTDEKMVSNARVRHNVATVGRGVIIGEHHVVRRMPEPQYTVRLPRRKTARRRLRFPVEPRGIVPGLPGRVGHAFRHRGHAGRPASGRSGPGALSGGVGMRPAIAKAKIVAVEKGTVPICRSARRVLRTNGGCPLFPPETSETSLPVQLGEYRLIERLGSGGMGAVYKAVHNRLDRVVALKILPRARTDDQRAIVRFEREMKAIGRLDHPHIVRAYDAREIEDRLVLVMEFVEGLDLGQDRPPAGADRRGRRLRARPAGGPGIAGRPRTWHGPPRREAVEPDPHARGPGETARPRACTIPGGTAVLRGRRRSATRAPEDEMTGTGQAMGTADYMAPEQTSDSRTVDIRADIYGLGATLYKLLSGRAPFSGPEYQGTFEKMLAHRQAPPPPIRPVLPGRSPRAWPPCWIACWRKTRPTRYSTPTEAAEALAPFCAGSDLPALLRNGGDAEARASRSPFGRGPGRGHLARSSGRDAQPLCGFAPLANYRGGALSPCCWSAGSATALGSSIRIHNQDGEEATLNVANGSNVTSTPRRSRSLRRRAGRRVTRRPRTRDLQFEIAKVAGELAAQKALLKNVDESDVPQVEIDQLVQNDPVAKQLSTELGWKKMDQMYDRTGDQAGRTTTHLPNATATK